MNRNARELALCAMLLRTALVALLFFSFSAVVHAQAGPDGAEQPAPPSAALPSAAPPSAALEEEGEEAEEDEPRLIFGFEAAAMFPVATPHLEALWPGATLAVAAHASLLEWLMPTLRLRGAILADQASSNAFPDPGVGTLLEGMGGIRFRPRGIAHPEEVPRATCIWAEADAGIGLWNGRWQPIFEATIGFDFEVGPVDLGPVVHFTHVLPTRAEDGPDAFLLSVGLEVLVNDAR